MTRLHPYRLLLHPAGQVSASHPITFGERDQMEKRVKSLVKSRFIGSIVPQVWDDTQEEWAFDAQMMEDNLSNPSSFNERQAVLSQASSLLASLAKEAILSNDGRIELIEVLQSIAEICSIPLFAYSGDDVASEIERVR